MSEDYEIWKLKAEVESIKQDYINTGLDLADARREIRRLKSENERLRLLAENYRLSGRKDVTKDAKRYRWAINHPCEFCEILFDYDESGPPSDEKVNRRLAVAMKGGE